MADALRSLWLLNVPKRCGRIQCAQYRAKLQKLQSLKITQRSNALGNYSYLANRRNSKAEKRDNAWTLALLLYMGIRNKSFLLVAVVITLLASSCGDSSSIEMRNLLGFNIPTRYTEYYREELWVPIIGDGYKVVVFSLSDSAVSKIPQVLEDKGFTPIQQPFRIQDKFSCQLQYEVLEGATLSEEKDGERKMVIWDKTNKRMIYLLVIY